MRVRSPSSPQNRRKIERKPTDVKKPNGKQGEPLGNEPNLIASRRILQNMRPLLVSPIRGNLLKKIVAPVVVVNPSGILPGRSLTIRQRKELYLHKRQPSPHVRYSER